MYTFTNISVLLLSSIGKSATAKEPDNISLTKYRNGCMHMKQINLKPDTVTMFIRCQSSGDVIYQIPDIVTGLREEDKFPEIQVSYVKNKNASVLPIYDIRRFYYENDRSLTYTDFSTSKERCIVFTVDLEIQYLTNLHYILVLANYLSKKDINFFIILNTDDTTDTYFKIYHYFCMHYSWAYTNIYIRKADQSIVQLPSNDSLPMAGEILPFLAVDTELYKSCFCLFEFNRQIFDEIKRLQNQDAAQISAILVRNGISANRVEAYMLSYIYRCLTKDVPMADRFTNFIQTRPSTPLWVMLLFSAFLNKSKKSAIENIDIIYENCFDYAFSLEQLIENSLFYANNGILTMRIHQTDAPAISHISTDEDPSCKFLLEVCLIDYQENTANRSFILNFVKHADADEQEKEAIKSSLYRTGIKDLFQYSESESVRKYFEKPEVLIQHYGLQTIGILSKKSDAFLCVRNGDGFYANTYSSEQTYSKYKYQSGLLYNLFIPIKDNKDEPIYIGFSSNNSYSVENLIPYPMEYYCKDIPVPNNRDEKARTLKKIIDYFTDEFPTSPEKHIVVINAGDVSNRLQLECLIKAVLSVVYNQYSVNTPVKIAIIGFRNKTYIKMALRFIGLCYSRQKENRVFATSEIFLCTGDCKTEILVAGKNCEDILRSFASQRVFGTIDDEVFREMKFSIN